MPPEGASESSMGQGSRPVSREGSMAKQAIYIAAIKTAVGMENRCSMFEMKILHKGKQWQKLNENNQR